MRASKASCHHRGARRRWAWLLLAALVFAQAKVALAGCLLDPAYRESAVPAHAAATHGVAAEHECCPERGLSERRCAEECAPSAAVPKPAVDHAALVPAFDFLVLPLAVPSPADAAQVHATVPRVAAGPPVYLRLLRLLN